MLFADDAALVSHTEEGLQRLIDQLAQACTEFDLKNTNVMSQEISEAPAIHIIGHTLEVVQRFTYLRSTIASYISLNVEINKRIGKTASVRRRLSKRMWENNITENTKVRVCQTKQPFTVAKRGQYMRSRNNASTVYIRRIICTT